LSNAECALRLAFTPDRLEGAAGHHPLHRAADQLLEPALDRAVQITQQLGHPWGNSLLRRRVRQLLDQRIHVDLRQHGGGDPVRDRFLHIGIARQRPDGIDVAVRVLHDAVRPHRDDGQQRQQRSEQNQQDRAERAERVMPRRPGRPGTLQGVHPLPQLVQLTALPGREPLATAVVHGHQQIHAEHSARPGRTQAGDRRTGVRRARPDDAIEVVKGDVKGKPRAPEVTP
jgi:hypothetical protein